MDEYVARMIAWSILSIAVVVWLISVRYVGRAQRPLPRSDDSERFGVEPPVTPRDELVGEVPIDAAPAGLAARLARALAQAQAGPLGPLKLTHVDDDHVAFEQLERQGHYRIRDGEVQFARGDSGGCVARYRLKINDGRGLLVAANLLILAGLIAIVSVWAVMEYYVIPNPQPAVRGQVVQSCQVVHLLWPPFLLAFLYKNGRRTIVTRMEALLANLPHQV